MLWECFFFHFYGVRISQHRDDQQKTFRLPLGITSQMVDMNKWKIQKSKYNRTGSGTQTRFMTSKSSCKFQDREFEIVSSLDLLNDGFSYGHGAIDF